MSAFALFNEVHDALRDAKARTGLNSGARGILAVSVEQGRFRVEIVTHKSDASGKCDVTPLTQQISPEDAAKFLREYNA